MDTQQNTQNKFDRREVLRLLALTTGYTVTAGTLASVVAGCKADTKATGWQPAFFTADEMSIIEEATERIWPKTDTPGAKDALVARYVDESVKTVFTAENQTKFKEGLAKIDKVASDKYKKNFAKLDDAGKDDVLSMLAKEMKADDKAYSIFKELRSLTIGGFATSEVGAKQFFKFNPVPGPYQGCVDYSTIGGTWATT
jgi:gluconate 2-dehydrogenase gamma chain